MFHCWGWECYYGKKKLRLSTLEHVNDVKYIPLISFLWKLVLKLEFISSRSPLFFFVHLLQCHQQPTESKLCGFYCAYHMLKLKDSGPDMEVVSWDLHL
jgi:hypothetical protein